MDEYGIRYDLSLGFMDALDHMTRIWKPSEEATKHIYKIPNIKKSAKSLTFHVKYWVFWEFYHLNKKWEYRLFSKYWSRIYKNNTCDDPYKFVTIMAAYNPKCQLTFTMETMIKSNDGIDVTHNGLRIKSSKPMLKIFLGECIECRVDKKSMISIERKWNNEWKYHKGTRLYNFDVDGDYDEDD